MTFVFAENQHVAAKIGGQWFDAYVVGRNVQGGVVFYTVRTLDGNLFIVRDSENPLLAEISAIMEFDEPSDV